MGLCDQWRIQGEVPGGPDPTSFPGPFPLVGGGAGKGPGIGRSDQHFDWLIDLNNLCEPWS